MNPIGVSRNNYLESTKESTIFTPEPVCKWLREIVRPYSPSGSVVFDPAVGIGNLLVPFLEDCSTMANDIKDCGDDRIQDITISDFLLWPNGRCNGIDLVLCNPPYNHDEHSRSVHGKTSLLPEMFAEKIFKIFGKDVPLVLFVPMGYRLNQRCYKESQGTRYRKMRDEFGEITSIVTLPLDLFHNNSFDETIPEQIRNVKKGIMKSNIKRVETQQEIIFYNMPLLKPHYFLPDSVINELREYDN